MTATALIMLILLAGCEQAPVAKASPKYVTQDFKPDHSKRIYASAEQISDLHSKAKAACHCVRKKGHEATDPCWSDFWEKANRYKSSGEWASACAAGSSAGIDFDQNPDKADIAKIDRTVITQWPYGACSADEVPARKAKYEAKSGRRGC